MTTVINFNYLNFDINDFWSKESNHGYWFNNEKNQDALDSKTIDVTAQSRVVKDEDKDRNRSKILKSYKDTSELIRSPLVATTYDRNGKIVHSIHAKGLKVDCFA